jgi:hypothetical protein
MIKTIILLLPHHNSIPESEPTWHEPKDRMYMYHLPTKIKERKHTIQTPTKVGEWKNTPHLHTKERVAKGNTVLRRCPIDISNR